MTAASIVATGITKRFGAVTALNDVDLDVRPGEVLGLAGENGSGKSTLVRILAGVMRPDAGRITVDGEDCEFQRPKDALERGIALVMQELTAAPRMSVAENVLMSTFERSGRLISRRRLWEEARPLLDQVGVKADPSAPFQSLRPGDRELVELAKALALKPRLLILDEATSRLGERDADRLFDLVVRLREQGTSTILITHRLREYLRVADRVIVLRDGRRVGELAREELSEERLSATMVGREIKGFFGKRDVPRGDVVLHLEDFVADGAVAPVSLEVRAGEIVGLAGLVGCGRSELLESVAGVRRPHGGRALVGGRPVRQGSPQAAIQAGIFLVPEDRHTQGLNLKGSARENIAMATWRRFMLADRRAEARLALEAVRALSIVIPDIETRVTALSGGNQQKVVFGRSFGIEPRVLLLDEPTRGVDVGAKQQIYEIIGDMVERGMAVLMASSDLLELMGVCDRIVVLHERRLVGEVPRAEATEERIVLLSGGGGVGGTR
jgi:ABC-type sugar transport system ATPase subunit